MYLSLALSTAFGLGWIVRLSFLIGLALPRIRCALAEALCARFARCRRSQGLDI